MRKIHVLHLTLIVILFTGNNLKSAESAKNESQKDNIESAFQACKIGDLNRIKQLISNGVELNVRDSSKYTLLHCAALNGQIEIVKFLVTNGADIHATDYRKYTPLFEVIGSYISNDNFRNKEKYIDIIEFFISNGADSNLLDILKSSPMEPPVGVSNGNDLTHSSQTKIVKLLIDRGKDINEKDKKGNTPLIMALKNKNMKIVELLISKGADTNVLDKWDKTEALVFAAASGYKNIVELLVNHGADLKRVYEDDNTILHAAAGSDSKETVEYLLSKGADLDAKTKSGDTPLCIAIRTSNRGDYLPNAKDSSGYFSRGQSFFWRKEFNRAIEDFTIAIDMDPNEGLAYLFRGYVFFEKGDFQKAKEDCQKAIQLDWRYALFLYENRATSKSLDEELNHLIKETAFIHFQDLDMVTGNYIGYGGGPGDFYTASLILSDPFDENIFLNMLKNDKPVVRAMGIVCLAREALPKYENNIRSLYNDTASISYMPIYDFGSSITIGKLAKNIIEDPETLDYWSPEVAKHLYEMQSDSNYRKKENNEVIQFFIEKGAEVNTRDIRNDTPLHFAASLRNTNIAEMLISHGAEINAQNKAGESPLRIATYWGNSKMIELLIGKGADINIKDKEGRTPLKFAAEMKYSGIADLLRQHGAKE